MTILYALAIVSCSLAGIGGLVIGVREAGTPFSKSLFYKLSYFLLLTSLALAWVYTAPNSFGHRFGISYPNDPKESSWKKQMRAIQ
jgi:hypothetical protein